MDIFERFPLALFSAYTQVQAQIIANQRNRVLEDLELAFPGESVYGPSLNDAYGDFWLWALGAYEVTRTMSEHAHCFSEAYATRLQLAKKRLAAYRIPFAKQQLARQKGSNLLSEASIAVIDVEKRDIAFIVGDVRYWVRSEMSAVGDLLSEVTLTEILYQIQTPRPAAPGSVA